jgi:hypothetical protein
MSVEVSFRAGIFPSITIDAPGAQGATVAGIHGIGASTPMAAEVAEATIGLARLVHIPNGMILTRGLLSMILAAGMLAVNIRFVGKTISELAARPKLHCRTAPEQTCMAMVTS